MNRLRRQPALMVALVLVGAAMAWTAWHGYRAASAAQAGQRSLLRVEADIARRRLPAARQDLQTAASSFARARSEVRALGPVGAVGRRVPLVRVQIRGAERFADAGLALTRAGTRLVDAAAHILDPRDTAVPVATALDDLKATQAALQSSIGDLDQAIGRVRSLDHVRLLGPLGDARHRLTTRLPQVRARAASTNDGLRALIAFAGGSGSRRYLVLSQNPDEVRPTGGFIGTYGVLGAGNGRLALERYDSIESWYKPRPAAAVPPEQAGSPFRLDPLLGAQTLANVNNTPDWPASARLAADLWQRGGEEPVDGVLSFSTGFLVRVLAVVGPVKAAGYPETVTAANAVARIDFHVHESPADAAAGNRKEFVSALAEAVLGKLLQAPATKWDALGRAGAKAFDGRELMLWANDPLVQDQLRVRRWDGTLPATAGDFFYEGDFEYAGKNGRALKRTYDHRVALRPDGSARITTTVTIADTKTDTLDNVDSLSYITLYGPAGAQPAEGGDDPASSEPPLADHPANGWFASAPPGGTATFTAVWDAPGVAHKLADGSWAYGLYWMGVPDHTGDEVRLHVELPKGWRWRGKPPPQRTQLGTDLIGVWPLSVPSGG